MSTVKVELPKELLDAAHVSSRQAAAEVKKMVVLYLYARGNVTLAKATEWLGISQWEFLELNQNWGLLMHYDTDDYRQDSKSIRALK